MFDSVFHQIAAVLFLAVLVAMVGRRLRQPLIVAFILTGIAVGPSGAGIVGGEEVSLLAHIGIAILLFIVGLKLDIPHIRAVGPVALIAGSAQILLTGTLGFGLALALGIDPLPALYVGIALTFSSTIVIVKLLSDRDELDAPHGRIAMGILIVQDLVVVLVMIVLTAFGGDGDRSLPLELGRVFLTALAFLAVLAALMRWVIPPLMERLAQTTELLVLFAIAWAVALAAVGDALDFSEEVGAFLAGVSLASTPFRDAIGARLVSLRDFLLLFFFIDLGARLDLGAMSSQLLTAAVLAVFVLVGKPLIVVAVTGFLGYRNRVGFRAGIALSQISEFSLLLAALALDVGHIDEDTVGIITAVGLLTIAASTYLIGGSDGLQARIGPRLAFLERENPREADFGEGDEHPPPRLIVAGLGRYGAPVLDRAREAGIPVLGVDFDPEVLQRCRAQDHHSVFGDIEDPELLGTLPLDEVEWFISTTNDLDASLALLSAVREGGLPGRVAVTAHGPEDVEVLEEAGADLVLLPFHHASEVALSLLGLDDRDPESSAPT